MAQEEMIVNGEHLYCPKCNAPLKIRYTVTGDDEIGEDFEIDNITTEEVSSRIFFNEILLTETISDNKVLPSEQEEKQ